MVEGRGDGRKAMESNGDGISARRSDQSVDGEHLSTRFGYVLDRTVFATRNSLPIRRRLRDRLSKQEGGRASTGDGSVDHGEAEADPAPHQDSSGGLGQRRLRVSGVPLSKANGPEDGQAPAVLLARTASDEGGSKQDSADRRVQPEATSNGEDSGRAKPSSPGMAKVVLARWRDEGVEGK